MSLNTPRYRHDCDVCKFLGIFKDYDLYFCPQGGEPTVIARYSSDGPDYLSGMPTMESRKAKPQYPLSVAHRAAIAQKCLPVK